MKISLIFLSHIADAQCAIAVIQAAEAVPSVNIAAKLADPSTASVAAPTQAAVTVSAQESAIDQAFAVTTQEVVASPAQELPASAAQTKEIAAPIHVVAAPAGFLLIESFAFFFLTENHSVTLYYFLHF